MRRVALLVLALAALAATAGCGSSDDRAEAGAVVARFYDAVRHDRGDEACRQLSAAAAEALESQSGQSCRAVITRLDYEGGAIAEVNVDITSAKVDMRSGESAYLDRGPAGWRLTAVGCAPRAGAPRNRPLDCQVEA